MPLVEENRTEQEGEVLVRVPVGPKSEVERERKEKTKKQPVYGVILHNDDINRLEWVVGVLRKILRCNGFRAFWLAMRVHVTGRGVIWTGSQEVAELKAEQIRSVGPDPQKVKQGAQPLKVNVEAMPG